MADEKDAKKSTMLIDQTNQPPIRYWDWHWEHCDGGTPCPNAADTWVCDEHGEVNRVITDSRGSL